MAFIVDSITVGDDDKFEMVGVIFVSLSSGQADRIG